MGEAKQRALSEIEQRAAMKAAGARRSRIRDRFGRGLEVGDGVLLGQADQYRVVWQITQMTPAVGIPNAPPGSTFVDLMSQTRVLFVPGMPADDVTLVKPAQAPEPADAPDAPDASQSPETSQPPGEVRSPGGIILSDPDRMSER